MKLKSHKSPSVDKTYIEGSKIKEMKEPTFSLENYPDLPKRYELLSLLGEGAFSQVYKAWDSVNSQYVAIKIVNKLNLTSKQLRNITQEISIMKQINHPNILKLLDSYESFSNYFLVLEFINGGEIFNKIIEFTYFSEILSKHIFLQLLSSLEYLHLNNIVHRDIKPENLLFKVIPLKERENAKDYLRKSDDINKKDEGTFIPNYGGGSIGIIKLADFGLAKKLPSTNVNALKTPCGTAGYTAPEIIHCNDANVKKISINKNNYYNKSVDIWSLGCFLYTILCGFPPFYDDDSNQLTMKIINGDYKFLSPWWDEISTEVKDLINKMLITNPVERITIEEIWNHPWIKDCNNDIEYSYFQNYRIYPVKEEDEEKLMDDNCLSVPLNVSNQPLLSPMAHAIKQVFDNPVMTGNDEKNYEQSNVHFVETFSDEDDLHYSRMRLPKKSPMPTKFPSASFRNVFVTSDDNEDEDDDNEDDDDEYEEDDVASLTQFKVKSISVSIKHKSGIQSTVYDDFPDNDLSSTLDDDDDDDEECENSEDSEYHTRCSSIISGITGEFKFTLNLNDSNLLSRRRSSVISKKQTNGMTTEVSECFSL